MQPLLAIAKLTWKAAFRYRLFWVLAVTLLSAVVLLPVVVKDDGTARGLVQILLTYTLSVTSFLLGLSTLWLSCGTLARDVDECQIQMVVVKPVGRWQIWLGKWLGILALNTALLSLAGVAIYSLLQWRAASLTPRQQQILREEVMVARAGVKPKPPDLNSQIESQLSKIPNRARLSAEELKAARQHIAERVYLEAQVVGPRQRHPWEFDLGLSGRLRGNEPLFIRVKFYSASTNSAGLYEGLWMFATPGSDTVNQTPSMRLAPDSFQEFQVPRTMADAQGRLLVVFQSQEDASLVFSLDDGIEILYRDGGFGLNFFRGLGILLAWLALLSALGLAAASITSFPVAAFCSISVLVVAMSSSTLAESVANETVIAGRPEDFQMIRPVANAVFLPLFKGILAMVNLVNVASPIELLSTGRSITWVLLGEAWFQVVFIAGGVLAVIGIWLLTRRELATAQGTH